MAGKEEVADGGCTEALTAMYLFLDKEQLSSEERSHVQEHLDACIPCLESFEFEAELKQVIKRKCSDEVPTDLYQRVRSSLEVEITSAKQPKQPPLK